MAAATCFYHPDQVASTVCSQCSLPLCSGCTETVAGKPVCRRCVETIRARVSSQMSAPEGAAPPQAGPSVGFALPSANVAAAAVPVPGMSALGLLLGGVFGALIGIAGAFLLAKIEFYSNFQVGLLNSLVGFGVGYGVLLGCKRGGLVPAVMGGVLAFLAMMLSEYFFFQDEVAKVALARPELADAASTITFADHISHMTIDWVFVAIGVYGGAKTPLRAGQQGAIRR